MRLQFALAREQNRRDVDYRTEDCVGRLAGKRILITGAGSGLGRAICLRSAEEGAEVVAADINLQAARQTIEEIQNRGGQGRAQLLDVTDESHWQSFVDCWADDSRGFDGLVSNAGVELTGTLSQTTLTQWRRVLDVNLAGVFLGARSMTPLLLRSAAQQGSAGASIVNLSSIFGLVGFANASAYAASKGAVRLFTKAAALEFAAAKQPVRVNAVHPGFVRTPMTEEGAKRMVAAGTYPSVDAMFSQLADIVPVGRLGTAREVANGVLFLLSDESSYVTGTELIIDGGYTAQ